MLRPIYTLLNAKRPTKRLISVLYDICAITISLYLSIALRLGTITFSSGVDELVTLVCTVVVTILSFMKLGMYRAVLRYMMLPAVGNIFLGVFVSTLTLVLCGFFFQTFMASFTLMVFASYHRKNIQFMLWVAIIPSSL